MIFISWIGWKLTKEKTELVERMMNYFKKCLEETSSSIDAKIEIIDAASYENPGEDSDYLFVFGKTAQGTLSDQKPLPHIFYLPDLDKLLPTKENAQNRTSAMEVITAAVKDIVAKDKIRIQEKSEKVEAVVKTKEEVTVGEEKADILISKKEADYLIQIKTLLAGNFKKIRLIKGDTIIEVEE